MIQPSRITMANRNCNISSEIEPRVPRHPSAALAVTVPAVPEVSLAFDTPHQRNSFRKEPRSSALPSSYAHWKQQVPHQPASNNKIDAGVVRRISRSNSSPQTSTKPSTALAITEKTQNLPPNTFTRDSRLKFYQKIGPDSSPAETKILPTNNPMKSSPRRLQRSPPVAARHQRPSDLVPKEKLEVSLNPQIRTSQIQSTCDCHSHQSDNTEIINKLLSLVQSQNAQIQVLQGQVETLLSMRAERPREFYDYQRLPLPSQNIPSTMDPAHQNQRFHYPNSSRETQEFEEKTRDDKCKQLIKEKKVSIGVMTSFELTVQDSVVYNVDGVAKTPDYQDKSPHSAANKNLASRTPAPLGKIPNGPLEQIIEDSESHLSSTVQASNNFHTYSSARKSLQGNFQGDLSTCVESPQDSHQPNPVVPASQTNQVGRREETDSRTHRHSDVASAQRRSSNAGNPFNPSPNQQQYSPTSRALPSNLRDEASLEKGESVKKTPKVGWTLYDNVMCQVNEILHNTQEENVEKRQDMVQETSGSKLLLNGIQQSTVEQLKLFGFTFADTSGCSGGRSLVDGRRMNPIPIDASYYPRLDYQANVIQTSSSASDSNTSLHMKALAMKYLGTKQLPNVSSHQRGMELFTSMVLNNIQNNMPGVPGNEVPKIDHNPPFQESPKALPDCQRENYLIRSKQSPQNILDISNLKRQPKLL